MRKGRTATFALAALILILPASGEASWYGSGRFRTIEIRSEQPGLIAVVQAYLAEGTQVVADPSDPTQDYRFSFICAQIYTPDGRDQHCGDGLVQIDWPLLETARLQGSLGSIDVDLVIEQRGQMRLGPLATMGLPPFAHVGVTGFRPGTATGSITSDVGSAIVATDLVGMHVVTSAYGTLS